MAEDDFLEEIRSEDRRRTLMAMRDLVAGELATNRCKNCQSLQMRSGEASSLVKTLKLITDEILSLPSVEEVTTLDELRAKREAANRAPGASDTPRPLGSKNSQRRTGGRRPRS